MISVTYVFETDDRGKEEEVVCSVLIEKNRKNVTSEEEKAMEYFVDMVKTSCSYEEGMEIHERS